MEKRTSRSEERKEMGIEAVPQLHEQRTSDGKKKTGQDFEETIQKRKGKEGGRKKRRRGEGARCKGKGKARLKSSGRLGWT